MTDASNDDAVKENNEVVQESVKEAVKELADEETMEDEDQ